MFASPPASRVRGPWSGRPASLRRALDFAFRNVVRALEPGAPFVFDFTTDEAFLHGWADTCAEVSEKEAFFIRGRYDPDSRLGETQVTVFQQNGAWHR